jgi:hypothetical protein
MNWTQNTRVGNDHFSFFKSKKIFLTPRPPRLRPQPPRQPRAAPPRQPTTHHQPRHGHHQPRRGHHDLSRSHHLVAPRRRGCHRDGGCHGDRGRQGGGGPGTEMEGAEGGPWRQGATETGVPRRRRATRRRNVSRRGWGAPRGEWHQALQPGPQIDKYWKQQALRSVAQDDWTHAPLK